MGKRRGRGQPTVEGALSGHQRLDAVALMRLIHQVNPTGEALPPDEEARRYRQKASLQSALVRQHSGSLVIEPAREGVVSIRHSLLDLDACHAVVDELDEDARSLVRWRLDAGNDESAPVGRASGPVARDTSDGDPSTRGRRALEEYDYEEARSCFEAAWRAAAPGAEATECARQLLELLVDHLADYEAALALPVAAQGQDEAVRLLLARAAVRTGRPGEAERNLRGLDPSSAADTLAELAELHLAAGDAAAATRAVDRLGDAVPRHSSHADLERRAQALAGAARRNAEQAAEAALAAGQEDTAEQLCRAVVSEQGPSEVTRRILAELSERRARREALELRAQAVQAEAAGDAEKALRLLLRARSLAPGDAELAALVLAAERRHDAERRAAERRRAAEALAADLRAGLLAWASLDAEDRARVELDAELRRWGEHVLARLAPKDAVEALLALRAARASADARRAARLVAPHGDALRGLPALASIEEAAAREEACLATERSLAALAAAERALDAAEGGRGLTHEDGSGEGVRRQRSVAAPSHSQPAGTTEPPAAPAPRSTTPSPTQRAGDATPPAASAPRTTAPSPTRAAAPTLPARPLPDLLQAAASHLQDVARETLAPDDAARLDAALARQARASRVLELEQQARQLVSEGRSVEARDALDEAQWLSPSPERAARRAAIADAIQAEWRIRWYPADEADVVDEDFQSYGTDMGGGVSEDLRHAVVLTMRGGWAFVRLVAVDTGRVEHALRVRMPGEHVLPLIHQSGSTLTLVDSGFLVDVDLGRREIVRHVDLTRLLSEGARFDEACLVDHRHVFVTPGVGERSGTVRVLDLERRRVRRELRGFGVAFPVVSPAGVRVALTRYTDTILVVDSRGRPSPGRIPCPGPVVEILPCPGGDGLLVVTEGVDGLDVFAIDDAGAVVGGPVYLGGDETFDTAPSHDEGIAAFVVEDEEERELVVVDATGGRLSVVSRTPMPAAMRLLSPPSRRCILAVTSGEQGPMFSPVGRHGLVRAPRPPARFELPMLDREVPDCAWSSPERRELTDATERSSAEDVVANLDAAVEDGDVERALDLLGAASRTQHFAVAMAQQSRVEERFGEHPEVATTRAERAISAGRFAEALALLAPHGPESLRPGARRHFLHVRGLALFHDGDPEAARSDWIAARAHKGACDLDELLEALGPEGTVGEIRGAAGGRLHLGHLRALVARADALREAGDLEGARAALHRPEVWLLQEEQTQARLAEVHMDLHAATGRYAFTTALACAQVVGTTKSFLKSRHAPVDRPYDADRLRAVLDRAEAWLADPDH